MDTVSTESAFAAAEGTGRSGPAGSGSQAEPWSTQAEAAASRLEELERLAVQAEHVDGEGERHVRCVGDLSARIAEKMGWASVEVERLRRAARLHDIGKVGLPPEVLTMSGPGTLLHVLLRRTHAVLGAYILGSAPELANAVEIALSHHEHWNGGGYPRGLFGEEIPPAARIVAVADVYDALTHDRPYRDAWSEAEAVAEIQAGRGSHFEPRVVDAFLALHRAGELEWVAEPALAMA